MNKKWLTKHIMKIVFIILGAAIFLFIVIPLTKMIVASEAEILVDTLFDSQVINSIRLTLYAAAIATAEVEIAGTEPGEVIVQQGKAIVYGVTIPSNFSNQELAIAWVDFLLSDKGVVIMEANGQPPVIPAITDAKDKLPDALNKYVE